MECKTIDLLAAKYEMGELNYFQVKRFEAHLKKCNVCRKKYKTLILLGAVLYASSKTYTPSTLKLLFSSFLFKIWIIIISTAAVMSIGYISAKTAQTTLVKEKAPISDKLNINFKENSDLKVNNSVPKHINIISKDNDKEIQLKVNIIKGSIESREEK